MPMLDIPSHFFNYRYDGKYYPGANLVQESGEIFKANCQVFVYDILEHFGYPLPPLRSSDLWEDTIYTKVVQRYELETLDLLLWNRTDKAWGAHVGLYTGDGIALHLSKKEIKPVFWELEVFETKPEYRVFVGAKRVL